MPWKKGDKKNIIYKNNRINLILAVVFLLSSFIFYKIYFIQIKNYDFYTSLASGQHQIFSELEPNRGGIFMSDNKKEENGVQKELYPLATNKDFALVYAIPKDIENSSDVAEKLYIIFKKEQVKKEVDEFLKKQEENKINEEFSYLSSLGLEKEDEESKKREVLERYEALKGSSEYKEIMEIKREAEIKRKKDEIVQVYEKILKKKNDPYEPLEKKVDDDVLKKLYAIFSCGEECIDEEVKKLEIKEGVIYKKIDNQNMEQVKIKGISHSMSNYRFYPENNVGSHITGFVGLSGKEQKGKYGLEGFFNEELFGKIGNIKTERGAKSDVVIINDMEYEKSEDGVDLILTIDRSVQFFVCNKLNESVSKHGADSGSIIVVEPVTGKIISMCSSPDFDPNNYDKVEDISVYNNPAIFNQYEPGSIFKVITMAVALDQEKVTPETTYDDKGQIVIQDWTIKNSDYDSYGGHGISNMNTVLELSLNTGAIFAMQQVGPEIFSDYVKKFGFGEKTGIELETENSGDIRNLMAKKIKPIDAAVASFGQGISVTPLQMVMSYAAIANGGVLMKPYVVKEIIHEDGSKEEINPIIIRRIISEKAAIIVSGMMVNVVEGGHAKLASVKGYWVGGKTGTAEVASSSVKGYSGRTIHTFVGTAPIDNPKFTILVKLDNPKDVQYAASSAAPLFGEITDFLLKYYQVPTERK